MQFIRDVYAEAGRRGSPVFSFEFFTPKTAEGDRIFFERTLAELAPLRPGYCSVTYGAGGSTRQKTLDMVERIQREEGIPGMAHLTCVGSTREQIAALLEEARARGIRNILALRGDPPVGETHFTQAEGGFRFAHELVSLTREAGGFCVGVAGFPEGHLECVEGKEIDWARLKAKVDCGAQFVITQLFFDNAFFYEFRDHLTRKLGVEVPIIPGIVPVLSGHQVQRFKSMCGASLPRVLTDPLHRLGDQEVAVVEFGIEFATAQCADLLAQGVPGIHLYTLNKAYSTGRILANLGKTKDQGTPRSAAG